MDLVNDNLWFLLQWQALQEKSDDIKNQGLGYCWKQCVSGWKKLDDLINGDTRMKKF